MSSVGTTNATQAFNVFATDDSVASASSTLTPDGLLLYCESRLNGLDAQISARMTAQNKANQDAQALSTVIAAFNNCTARGFWDLKGHGARDLLASIQNAINLVGEGTPLGAALKTALWDFANQIDPAQKLGTLLTGPNAQKGYWQHFEKQADGSDGDWANLSDIQLLGKIPGTKPVSEVSADVFKGFVDRFSNFQKDLNQGTELGMIQLQSLMSQRQMAVQITTNLVQSLGDQLNKICTNIGH